MRLSTTGKTYLFALYSILLLLTFIIVATRYTLANENLEKKLSIEPSKIVYFINSEIDETNVQQAIKELSAVLNNKDEAFLLINSPGGSVFYAEEIVYFIEKSTKPIYTVCLRMCGSMAAYIFNAGKKRYVTELSILYHHQISGPLNGFTSERITAVNYIKNKQERFIKKVSSRSKLRYEEMYIKTLETLYADFEDSLKLGLADALVNVYIKEESLKTSETKNQVLEAN